MISGAERQQRQEAVDDVIGTQRAEGIHLNPRLHALLKKYADGDLSLEQVSDAMDEHAQQVSGAKLSNVA